MPRKVPAAEQADTLTVPGTRLPKVAPAAVLPEFKERPALGRFHGTFKSINADRGFGFIGQDECRTKYGRDIYLSTKTWKEDGFNAEALVGNSLTFTLVEDQFGQPQANDVVFDDIPEVVLNPYKKADDKGKKRKEEDDDKGDGKDLPYYNKQRKKNEVETTGERHKGILKLFDKEKEFGFIKCEAITSRYTRDVFLSTRQWKELQMRVHLPVGTPLSFELAEDDKGHPHAIGIALEQGMVASATETPEQSVADRVAAAAEAFAATAEGHPGLSADHDAEAAAILRLQPQEVPVAAVEGVNNNIADMLGYLSSFAPVAPAGGIRYAHGTDITKQASEEIQVGCKPGCMVRIHGLRNAVQVNEEMALAEKFDEQEGRWMVRLQKNQELVAIKPVNLQVLAPPTMHSLEAVRIRDQIDQFPHMAASAGIVDTGLGLSRWSDHPPPAANAYTPQAQSAAGLSSMYKNMQGKRKSMCPLWNLGGCAKGNYCEFEHCAPENSSTLLQARAPPAAVISNMDEAVRKAAKKLTQCPFLMMGGCKVGTYCEYSHELTGIQDQAIKQLKTCRGWTMGACLKGDKCEYAHKLNDTPGVMIDDLVMK